MTIEDTRAAEGPEAGAPRRMPAGTPAHPVSAAQAPAGTPAHPVSAAQAPGPEVRTEAIEALLVEKGLVQSAAVDALVERYEQDIGPLRGARVVAEAWTDPAFRARLLEDGMPAIRELGFGDNTDSHVARLVVKENTDSVHNLVVCTLCSCYPWAVLGLPPAWYKSPAYRSRAVREPRRLLAELGLDVSPDVEVRVWDSSAEVRYMVLPRRPPGTDGLDVEELTALVTRDSMIGVERL